MGKHGFMTPKAISNRIKSKGLQKLKFYCQMCEKQCRDENGFKCHTMSESHQRQLLLFGENSKKYLDDFSMDFKNEYVKLLKHRFNGRRVLANHVYQEYIADREHIHMNSTKWTTLTGFVTWLGRKGICKVDETEKGWFVTYIDRDPEAASKKEKKTKMAADDEERQERILMDQIERARAHTTDTGPSTSTELERADSEEKVVFAMPKPLGSVKKVEINLGKNALKAADRAARDGDDMSDTMSTVSSKSSSSSRSRGNEKKRSAIEELMAENEAGKKRKKKKDSWVSEGIVVKIITKDLGKDFFKAKGVIEEVFDTYGVKVKLLKLGKKIKLDQSHLETVIPQVGREVLVLNGAYEGGRAVLDKMNVDKYTVDVTMRSGPFKGRSVRDIPYEDVSKLHCND
eukprot:sb/3465356/